MIKEKHYKRMKAILTYDLEGRDADEQKILLEQTIKAAKELLKELQ